MRFITQLQRITVTILFTGCFVLACPQSQSKEVGAGKLKGIVVDWQDARVLYTKISIANKTFRKELAVDENGEFEIDLPVGRYAVTAVFPGFYKFRQRNIKIESGQTQSLYIKLKVIPMKPIKCPRGNLCL